MADAPDRSTFENLYRGKAPWDIERPQRVFVAAADQIKGSILDAGCGTGENALFFAGRGHRVTGLDYLEGPIALARQKATQRGISATFEVADALALADRKDQFDNVIDSGLFHVFTDADRERYVQGLAHVLKPGGRLYLLCFSDAEPGKDGPRRVSKKELEACFAKGWSIESLVPEHFEVRPDFKEMTFSEGGPKTWFAIIRRKV